MAHGGKKGQKSELITHNVEEEEEHSPKAVCNTHTLPKHCLENQALCASTDVSAGKVNMSPVYSADGFFCQEKEQSMKT